MNDKLKFAILNGVAGAIAGGFLAIWSPTSGYWIFGIGAPIAAFSCAYFFWHQFTRKENRPSNSKLFIIGLLSGSVSHYLCWIILGVGMNICYSTTGNCTDSLGSPPIDLLSLPYVSLNFSLLSLLFLGWITVPVSIGIGFLVRKLSSAETS